MVLGPSFASLLPQRNLRKNGVFTLQKIKKKNCHLGPEHILYHGFPCSNRCTLTILCVIVHLFVTIK